MDKFAGEATLTNMILPPLLIVSYSKGNNLLLQAQVHLQSRPISKKTPFTENQTGSHKSRDPL